MSVDIRKEGQLQMKSQTPDIITNTDVEAAMSDFRDSVKDMQLKVREILKEKEKLGNKKYFKDNIDEIGVLRDIIKAKMDVLYVIAESDTYCFSCINSLDCD